MPEQPRQHSLRGSTVRGVLWSGFGQTGAAGLRFLVLLALAWRLAPSDFGLVGLALIFLLFTEGVGDLGLVGALIQRERLQEGELSTAFWANLSIGLVLMGLAALTAPQISAFLGDPEAAPLLLLLSTALPVTSLSAVSRALLLRQMKFRSISMQQVLAESAFGLTGLLMAFWGWGAWSIAGAVLAHRISGSIFLCIAAGWRPRLRFRTQSLRSLMRFGLPFMAGAVLNRSMANADYFVVGHWLGTSALGYYTLAFQLTTLPVDKLTGVLRKVAFPAASRIQSAPERMRKAFLEGLRHTFAAITGISLMLAVFGPAVLKLTYGEKWQPATSCMTILAVAGAFYAFDIGQAFFFALGRPQWRLWVIGLRLGVFAALAFGGIRFGIVGVAACVLGGAAVSALATLIISKSLVNATAADLLKACRPGLRGLGLALVSLAWLPFLPSALTRWPLLIAAASLGGAAYLAGLLPEYRSLGQRIWREASKAPDGPPAD